MWYKERDILRNKKEAFESVLQVTNPELYEQMHEMNKEDDERKRRPLDIPNYLVCRISDELMEEPVMIETGFTFEK